jgi:hypothetical protein
VRNRFDSSWINVLGEKLFFKVRSESCMIGLSFFDEDDDDDDESDDDESSTVDGSSMCMLLYVVL